MQVTMVVKLVPMSDEQFTSYYENAIADYAKNNIEAGLWPADGALQRSRSDFQQSLPDGLHTQNNYLFEIVADKDEASVGVLWFAVVENHGVTSAFIYDIEIHEPYCHNGFAENAFKALESAASKLGLKTIELHVFGNNMECKRCIKSLAFASPASIC